MSSTSDVDTTVTQYGNTAPLALPTAIQSKLPSPSGNDKISAPAHVLRDAERYIFNMQLVAQTDATADPKVAAPVFAEAFTSILNSHTTELMDTDWIRVTYRPRAGKI